MLEAGDKQLERRASWDVLVDRWRRGNAPARAEGWDKVGWRVTKILGNYSSEFSWESKAGLEWIGGQVIAWQIWADGAVNRGITINVWSAEFRTWVRAAAARSDRRWNHHGHECSAEELEEVCLERQFFVKWCDEREKPGHRDGLAILIAEAVKNKTYAQWLTWHLDGLDYEEIAARHAAPVKLATIRSGVKRALDVVIASPTVREYLMA